MSGFLIGTVSDPRLSPKNGWKMKPEPKKRLQDACDKTLVINRKGLHRSTS